MAKDRQIILEWPLGGVDENWARGKQPPTTSALALNVLPYGSGEDRARGGPRPGTSAVAESLGGAVRAMLQTTVVNSNGVRIVWSLAVAGDTLYASGAAFGGPPANYDVSPDGTDPGSIDGSADVISMCATAGGLVFIVDGTNISYTDLTESPPVLYEYQVDEYSPGVGKGTTPSGYRLCAYWSGRLVLGNKDDGGHLWEMSRQGDPFDFDPDPPAGDVGRAVIGQNANSLIGGEIGDPLTALIPVADDRLLFGGERRTWILAGDPGRGAQLLSVSYEVGVLGHQAWAMDASNTLWLIGTGGLYRLAGTALEPAKTATRVAGRFKAFDYANGAFVLAYDRQRMGLWILLRPREGAAEALAGDHLFYDFRTGGFWPVSFPFAVLSAMVYDGDDPADRDLFLGSGDDIFRLDDTTSADDGEAVESYVYLGPVEPHGPASESILLGSRFTLGELPDTLALTHDFQMDWVIQGGGDAREALADPDDTDAGSITTEGREAWSSSHAMAQAVFFVKLWVDREAEPETTFTFERLQLDFQEGRANV